MFSGFNRLILWKFEILGFDFIDMFYRDSKVSLNDIDFKRGIPNAHIQPVAVLRKRWNHGKYECIFM